MRGHHESHTSRPFDRSLLSVASLRLDVPGQSGRTINFLDDNAKFGIPADAVVPHVHARSKVNWASYDKIQLKPIVLDNGFASQLRRGDEEYLTLVRKSFYDMLSEKLSKTMPEAVLLAAKLKPAAVVMDIHLPVLSGVAAATLIKINNPFVSIIALTAADPKEDGKAMTIPGRGSGH